MSAPIPLEEQKRIVLERMRNSRSYYRSNASRKEVHDRLEQSRQSNRGLSREFPRSRIIQTLLRHPQLIAVAAVVVGVVGPRKIISLAGGAVRVASIGLVVAETHLPKFTEWFQTALRVYRSLRTS